MNCRTSVEAALDALSHGGVVIVMDSIERENEGDFLAAAQYITHEAIDFMITHGRGHLCQPISEAVANRIDVQPLVPSKDSTIPRFAMPVDHRAGSTGISPIDRALTARAIVDSNSRPDDFIRPGHMFPLIARDGGVLERPGHTEAAIDLTRLAGFAPSGVLCEICSRNGRTMAELPELEQLAEEFGLPIVTIDALIEYRQLHATDLEVINLADEIAADVATGLETAPDQQPIPPTCPTTT